MPTRDAILDQCARYPALRPQDLLKFLHQSTFGPGHLVADDAGGLDFLLAEHAKAADTRGVEPLDGDYVRAHLGLLDAGLSPAALWRCFRLSSLRPAGTAADLEGRLAVALSLAQEGLLPFSHEAFSAALSAWRSQGFPAMRHSQLFRDAYAPAYRVLHKDYAWMLPLLTAMDVKTAEGRPLLVAIDGGAGSGKSTLAGELQRIYDCPVFHMDDFFLRPHQRTPERLDTPGGNVDHERFLSEVLLPWSRGETVRYRRWDCHAQAFCPTAELPPAPLAIVEGSYSCHPALREHYGLTVFLSVSPALQRRRIEGRNAPEVRQRFFDLWIPLEQRYFEAFNIPGHCDLTLEVQP
ncbi:MAG: hypothetical protein IJX52_02795 [Oscillibacter sp.]|nr:hypothetical protein [Oscillibacter sp.]